MEGKAGKGGERAGVCLGLASEDVGEALRSSGHMTKPISCW
jgi:hypothetical protein